MATSKGEDLGLFQIAHSEYWGCRETGVGPVSLGTTELGFFPPATQDIALRPTTAHSWLSGLKEVKLDSFFTLIRWRSSSVEG